MKKYNEEYFSVIETKTGRKIVDCGDEMDAHTMVSFDPQNRTITRNKVLMSQVIDVEIPKALPTTNVVVSNVKEGGCTTREQQLLDAGQLRFSEGQGEPVRI
jgi:hypothetical protein